MTRWMALGLVSLFVLLMLASPAQAGSHSHTTRYFAGGDIGFGVLLATCTGGELDSENKYGFGGTCSHPCPDGKARITVTDDFYGTRTWFRVQIDDATFFSAGTYFYTDDFECNTIRVAVAWDRATTGIIELEPVP